MFLRFSFQNRVLGRTQDRFFALMATAFATMSVNQVALASSGGVRKQVEPF